MPYPIVRRGDKWCVINPETGKSKGCHDTKAQAREQQKALYANADPEKERKGDKK